MNYDITCPFDLSIDEVFTSEPLADGSYIALNLTGEDDKIALFRWNSKDEREDCICAIGLLPILKDLVSWAKYYARLNKGELAEVTRYLAENHINIKALSIADTQDFGILRIICENSENVEKVLKEGGYIITVTDVLAAAIADEPGSMAAILEVLAAAHVMVEYTYAFIHAKVGAYMIFRVDDNEKAAAALAAAGIQTAGQDD